MSTQTVTPPLAPAKPKPTRDEILKEIAELESRVRVLRHQRPSLILPFWRFKLIRPAQSYVLAYAPDLESAKESVFNRLSADYGPDGFALHPKVDKYNSPEDASANSSGNLCRCLPESEALEFISDFKAAHAHDPVPTDGRKHYPSSGVKRDIADWKYNRNQASR